MDDSADSIADINLHPSLQRLVGVFWNGTERRPRTPFRLGAGFLLFLLLAGAGNQYRPTLLMRDGPIPETINMLSSQLPNALGLGLAVVLAALLVDRRHVTDLGLDVNRRWWRELGGGAALGAGISLLAIVVGLGAGYYEVTGVRLTSGLAVWIPLAVGAAVFQLLFVVPEELFVRGYVLTNVVEGLDGVPSVGRPLAAGVGIILSSALFYLTHASAKGATVGLMMFGLSLLLGVGYVLSGNLSVPIGIHFGFNAVGVVGGINPQPASLLEMTAASTVHESVGLPVEAVAVRMVGTVVALGMLFWWYHSTDGRLRVAPAIARPALRWRRSRRAGDD